MFINWARNLIIFNHSIGNFALRLGIVLKLEWEMSWEFCSGTGLGTELDLSWEKCFLIGKLFHYIYISTHVGLEVEAA